MKHVHPTYEKWPSDLRKVPIRPTKLSGRHATKAAECRSDVAVGRMGSIADGQKDGWAVERINITQEFL